MTVINAIKVFASTEEQAEQKRLSFNQRLLAEAVRLHEDAQGFAIDDPRADSLAREADGDLEHRLVARAQALPIAPALNDALLQLRHVSQWAVAAGVVSAALTGATAAQITLGSSVEGPVNFFLVLGGLLGVHTLALVVWLVLLFVLPTSLTTGSLGGAALALARRLTRWLHKGPLHIAVIRASASVYARSSLGRWIVSSISHTLWLAFLSGCLVLVLLILSTKQYNFAWETTILSDDTYVVLTRTLASLPEALGFVTPDSQQIIASHWTQEGMPPGDAREAWSGLLVGSIVAYGILPRAVLLIASLIAAWRASRRFRLDTSLPSYTRLRARLMPEAQSIGVVDADEAPVSQEEAAAEAQLLPIASQGSTAILGLEIERPQSGWTPHLNGIEWLDLGFVDSRTERQRALQQILAAPSAPRVIVVVCSLAATPDRGTRAFIQGLQGSSQVPVIIVLTEGQHLRERGYTEEEVKARIEDWRKIAAAAQVSAERVIEVDLNHLTEASRTHLAAVLGVKDNDATGQHLEQAFVLIMEHVQRWADLPSIDQQAELHRAIAELYRGAGQSWQRLLRITSQAGNDRMAQLKSSAERMVSLLPERLRLNPRWLAAGATAGALGCVAAATLAAPAAIAALPAWAGLGAAIAGLAQLVKGPTAKEPARADLTQAVSSAALFAIVLELQGYDEVTITRIIERTAVDDDALIDSAEAARRWLSGLYQRFVQAVAAEESR